MGSFIKDVVIFSFMKNLSEGTVHTMPTYLREAFMADPEAIAKWEQLTPLARNEWICWVTFPKNEETRMEHVERVISQLKEGKRRPCCWMGCIHRTDKAISPSVQWVLSRSKRK